MSIGIERNFSDLLRASGDVLREAEHRDVLLRRRDGDDMMLVKAEREDALREALVMSSQIAALVLERPTPKQAAAKLQDVAPWTTFLPDEARAELLVDFVRTARACGELRTFEPLALMLGSWKATAAVYADPQLLAELRAPADGTRRRVPRP